MACGSGQPDFFDSLPDPIFLLILNRVSDVKTLLRCRSLSRRFNSLVPQADSLLLRVDRVISASDAVSFISTLFHSLLASFQHLIPSALSGKPLPPRLPNSPSQILLGFDAIRSLRIELPSADLRLEKGASIKWVARFGKTLQSCVILAFRNAAESGCSGGLKMGVIWTITALIAASARHYMVGDVVSEQPFLSNLIVDDRENEGTLIMDEAGLREYREYGAETPEETADHDSVWWPSNRTTVPAVGISMRHEAKTELPGGLTMEGATLVVVRPRNAAEEPDEAALIAAAFGSHGVYAEAAARLLKCRCYVLETNSF
ncbi:F-box protein AUF2-like [Andrographis paniculata]|uniref:F-box protein AUF2-like n=1 Tax=Andrographis paniculata TaxID=175694 RepID=UPI0021E8924C|nr:F-box protein AUF2-like [Andrographis paniculata]